MSLETDIHQFGGECPQSYELITGPVTPMQELMFSRALTGMSPSVDVEHVDIDCPEGIDVDRLRAALDDWAHGFEVLRTGFKYGEHADVIQCVHESSQLPLHIEDLTDRDSDSIDDVITLIRERCGNERFNLSSPPLARVTLCMLPDGAARLIVTLHHLLYDGRCAGTLIGALFEYYDGIRSPLSDDVPRGSLIEFAKAVRSLDQVDSRQYFEMLLAGFEGPVDLRLAPPITHADRVVSDEMSAVGYVLQPVGLDLIENLTRTAERMDVTVNTLVQLAWAILLARYSGTSDVVWGATRACQRVPGIEVDDLVGMCINTGPCRLIVDPAMTLAAAASELGKQDVAIRPHELASPTLERYWCGGASSSALFTTLVVFERFLAEREVSRRVSSSSAHRQARILSRPGFDLTVMFSAGDAPQLELVYERAVVSEDVAARVADHWITLLGSISNASDEVTLGELAHLSEDRKALLLEQSKGASPPYPRDATIHSLFERMADATPEAICLKDDTRRFTYGEVERWANQVAAVLRQRGVVAGTCVPILTGRCIEYVVAVLAVLKAGGAYVPHETHTPGPRLLHIWEVIQARLVICTSRLESSVPKSDPEASKWVVILIDQLDLGDVSSERCVAESTELANVIFTSGSTDQPKGVMIPHRAIVRLVHNSFLPFCPDDVYLLLSSVAFDASTMELWAALLTGATLAISPESEEGDFEKIRWRIREHGVNRLWLTSTLFNTIVNADPLLLQGVATIMVGGEALSPSHVRRAQELLPDTCIVNGYGPTENTTFSTTHKIPQVSATASSIPIGSPIDHSMAIVLDLHGHPVDTGFAGELCLSGDGLALGYMGDESLTARSFVTKNLFGTQDRFYRSGDLVRRLEGGILDYMGRLDRQIKLRGFRIDPSEIETALEQRTDVASCAVLAIGTGNAKRLVGYVVAKSGSIDPDELKLQLQQTLPPYMVPSDFVLLSHLPITSNGKLDRSTLEDLAVNQKHSGTTQPEPGDEIERSIYRVFTDALNLPNLPLDVGLFDLGCNSLALMGLTLRMEREFGDRFPTHALATNPSIRDLARLIRGGNSIGSTQSKLIISMRGMHLRDQGKAPVFMLPGIDGDPVSLRHLADVVGCQRQVFGLRSPNLLQIQPLRTSVAELVCDFADAIDEFYPSGPVYLLGFSFGATVAYELAHTLKARGRAIEMLTLVDEPTCQYLKSIRRRFVTRLRRLLVRPYRLYSHVARRLARFTSSKQSLQQPNSWAIAPEDYTVDGDNQTIDYTWKPGEVEKARRLARIIGFSHFEKLQPIVRLSLIALAHYTPSRYEGEEPVHLLVTDSTANHEARDLGWHRVVGDKLKIWRLPGDHAQAIGPEVSQAIGSILRQIMPAEPAS